MPKSPCIETSMEMKCPCAGTTAGPKHAHAEVSWWWNVRAEMSLAEMSGPKWWEAVYIPVADGATATSQSQDEHGLTFEEFPPTETTSDFWPPFLVISSEINWPSLTGSLLGGINLTVTAVTGDPWSCKRKNVFYNSTLSCQIFDTYVDPGSAVIYRVSQIFLRWIFTSIGLFWHPARLNECYKSCPFCLWRL